MNTEEIIEQIDRRFRHASEKNLIVGVSGIDGSGKSTVSNQLESALSGRGIATAQINLDDFLNPKEIRHKNPNQIEGYFQDNFDFESLVTKVLEPARRSASFNCKVPVLTLETDQISDREFTFSGPGVLIIEGVFLFKKEMRDLFDFKIWLQIEFEQAMNRVLKRTRDKRYGNPEAIRARYEERFFPTQRFHLERDNPCEAADITINIS
ncbi:MAG: AAA family ATPase [Hyphomicrobiales bacterium]